MKKLKTSATAKPQNGSRNNIDCCIYPNGELFWCGIGDSHIYLYRAGELRQLNIDHNFGVHLDQMVQEETLPLRRHCVIPQRAALTKLSWHSGTDIDQWKSDTIPSAKG